MELQGRLGELKAKGLGLAAISYDPPHILADFTKRRGITFPLLSDPGSKIIKEYGLLNTMLKPGDSVAGVIMYGVPYPGTLILNRKGTVLERNFEEAYQERATVASAFLKLGAQGTAAVQHTTPHLEITTFTSDETVAPGWVFSLVLDVKPGRHIHVYAPGATDYKPIAFRLEPIPGVKIRPTKFPASETYHFVPLNERVPVYQKPFQLVQELNVEVSREGQALAQNGKLTITGTLDYQACDDKVCFLPMSVPLTWTVNVKKLDGERPTVPR